MKTLRSMPWMAIFLATLMVFNLPLLGQDKSKDKAKDEQKVAEEDAEKLAQEFATLAGELDDDLDELVDPLTAYANEVKAQEKKVADLTKKHGADSKQVKRAAKALAEQKANLAAVTKIVDDPKSDLGSADPLAAYAEDIKAQEKKIATLTKSKGADSKQVARAKAVLAVKKASLANLTELVDDNPSDTSDPLAEYAAEIKVLEKKLADVTKKSGKDSKQAKSVAKALAGAKANLAATTTASAEAPDVLIEELAARIALCKDAKQKKELRAKLAKLKELLPKILEDDPASPTDDPESPKDDPAAPKKK